MIVTIRQAWKKIIKTILLFALALLAGIGLGMLQRQFPVGAADISRQEDEQIKKVALTFDDGPNPIYTEPLLDGLKTRQVPVTFFVLGEEAECYPEILHRASEEGHLIGVHGYEHVNLRNLTDAQALEQVNRANQAIYEATGQYASLIRPPYGCWKEDLEEESRLIQVLWDVDPMDWATESSDLVVQRVLKNVEENSIILLHDASASSVQAAFGIIDALQAQGYTFVTVDDILFD
jgi:peptidoglycan/xylan/chitin deacetylase (PgdA/CDA1 family)